MLKQNTHTIYLLEQPNPHVLDWGLSGQGKTYFAIQTIANDHKNHRKIGVIDYSGSYTESELKKADFEYCDEVSTLNPAITSVKFISNACTEDLFIQESKDVLVKTLNVNSYNQSSLLFLALVYIKEHSDDNVLSWSIPKLIKALTALKKLMEYDEQSPDLLPNIDRLLTRLVKYENLFNFHVALKSNESIGHNERITIFQLSDLPEDHRFFLTVLLSELLWLETKRGKESTNFYNTIVYDEFHFLSVKRGSALSHFIREGRKYGVRIILSTQFISHYTEEEQETLLQAGNILIFKPTPRDLHFSAKVIDFNAPTAWKKILSKLPIGSAVLVGHYCINNGTKTLTKPIICKIIKEETKDAEELSRCIDSSRSCKSTERKSTVRIFHPSPRRTASQKSR